MPYYHTKIPWYIFFKWVFLIRDFLSSYVNLMLALTWSNVSVHDQYFSNLLSITSICSPGALFRTAESLHPFKPRQTEFNTMQFSHLVGSKLTHYCLNGCRNVFEQNFACSQPIKIMIKWFFFPNTILIKVNWIVAMEVYALQRN